MSEATTDAADLEIPLVFDIHAFACHQARPAGHPRGSCAQSGAAPLWQRLMSKVENARIPRAAVTASGCLGFCGAGPLMAVYPQGIWYAPKTEADIDEIVESHFQSGRPVERLIIVPGY
jgi:(2Fe-2S) ferredoxin